MNSLTKKDTHANIHVRFYIQFRGSWAPQPIHVFQVKPSVTVNPLLTDVRFYKIKYLLNICGSGNKSKLE